MVLIELHNVLRRVHRLDKGREVNNAQHLVRGQGAQTQIKCACNGQRAFTANQQMRQVDAAICGVGPLALGVKNV